ncbi:MAG TPA: hypothetical protein VGP79_08330 [Bryobacteraceae bacterium]|jgi:hypothetical protein|nr:hypothetical protein [Bryobacteraceae bacterium]
MSDPNDGVTVRLLPAAEPLPCRVESLQGRRLILRLSARPAAPDANGTDAAKDLKMGALVEVLTEPFLYLGEVLGRQEELLIVEVEHSVNRKALAAIQETWNIAQES